MKPEIKLPTKSSHDVSSIADLTYGDIFQTDNAIYFYGGDGTSINLTENVPCYFSNPNQEIIILRDKQIKMELVTVPTFEFGFYRGEEDPDFTGSRNKIAAIKETRNLAREHGYHDGLKFHKDFIETNQGMEFSPEIAMAFDAAIRPHGYRLVKYGGR